MPADPDDGQSLGYLPGETGYTLYAAGANGADDGGTPAQGLRDREGDQVFRVEYHGTKPVLAEEDSEKNADRFAKRMSRAGRRDL